MKETSKSIPRRLRDVAYVRYFAGNGIDVGCGDDSIGQYKTLFPLMGAVKNWDKADGDAQLLETRVADEYDWLHSSHCLEHLHSPAEAIYNWCRVVRPGGHLVVLVPDEDMYEQGVWPSRWNSDHKHTFTIHKARSWSPVSINVTNLLATVTDLAEVVRIERLESTWRSDRHGADQTADGMAECAIEFILRRRP